MLTDKEVEWILDRIEAAAIAHQHSQILHQIICDLIDEIRKELEDAKAN
jgi:hypothetical protein